MIRDEKRRLFISLDKLKCLLINYLAPEIANELTEKIAFDALSLPPKTFFDFNALINSIPTSSQRISMSAELGRLEKLVLGWKNIQNQSELFYIREALISLLLANNAKEDIVRRLAEAFERNDILFCIDELAKGIRRLKKTALLTQDAARLKDLIDGLKQAIEDIDRWKAWDKEAELERLYEKGEEKAFEALDIILRRLALEGIIPAEWTSFEFLPLYIRNLIDRQRMIIKH